MRRSLNILIGTLVSILLMAIAVGAVLIFKDDILQTVEQFKTTLNTGNVDQGNTTEDNTTPDTTSNEVLLDITEGSLVHNVVLFTFAGDDNDMSDNMFSTSSKNTLVALNQTFNLSEKSLKNYFKSISNNKLSVETDLIYKEDNVIITAPNSRGYYEPQGLFNPFGYSNETDRTNREQQLIKHIYSQASSYFGEADLDINNDGYIDAISFVYISSNISEPEWGELLWPHQWEYDATYGEISKINDATLKDFSFMSVSTILNESTKYNSPTLGWVGDSSTVCHELMHVVGFPDLYEYTSTPYTGVGTWDIMSSTSMQAAQYPLSYLRYKAGWVQESNIQEITKSGTYSLLPVAYEEANNVELANDRVLCYYIKNPLFPGQYIYIEYRAEIGYFDGKYVSGNGTKYSNEGLIVYRVDETVGEAEGYEGSLLLGNYYATPYNVYVFRDVTNGLASTTTNSTEYTGSGYNFKIENFITNNSGALSTGDAYGTNIVAKKTTALATTSNITYQEYSGAGQSKNESDALTKYTNSGIIIYDIAINEEDGSITFNIEIEEPSYTSYLISEVDPTIISINFDKDITINDISKIKIFDNANSEINYTYSIVDNKIVLKTNQNFESGYKITIAKDSIYGEDFSVQLGENLEILVA